jgi:diguanylate cyclase (GGDEF)-like protein
MKKNKAIIVSTLVVLSFGLLVIAAGMAAMTDGGYPAGRKIALALLLLSLLPVFLAVVIMKNLKEFARQAELFATRDSLTSLYNKNIFWDYLGYEIERAKRQKYRFAIMLVDLDDFKVINDAYSHEVGDSYLCTFSVLFKAAIRKGDIASRLGGDNFAAILPLCDESQAAIAALRLQESVRAQSFPLPDHSTAQVTLSIGMAVYPDHGQDAQALYDVADCMLHQAKVTGKDRVGSPGDELDTAFLKNASLKSIFILESIRMKRIVPYFQPIVDVENVGIMAYEVLTRIVSLEGVISAAEFIEEAEGMGAIRKIDYLLIEQAFDAVKRHGYTGKLFFNLSPKALLTNDFMPTMRSFMDQYNVKPPQLVFEITERETVKEFTKIEGIVHGLKDDGFQLAIDDFGSGYSSLQYLTRFRADYLKIDGAFIRSMSGVDNKKEKIIVSHIAKLAGDLGILTIAEYVESDEIMNHVKAAGIDYAQGYFTGRPRENLALPHGAAINSIQGRGPHERDVATECAAGTGFRPEDRPGR